LLFAGNEHNLPDPPEGSVNKEHHWGATEPSHRGGWEVQERGLILQGITAGSWGHL